MSRSMGARAGLGATVLADGSTRFRLWAPALSEITLESRVIVFTGHRSDVLAADRVEIRRQHGPGRCEIQR